MGEEQLRIAIRALDERADRKSFRCGAPALEEWLARQAGQAQRKRLASVWIASPLDDPSVILGYYSLAPWQVAFEECPNALRRSLPHYPIHVSLIARLAVALDRQGRGLGGVLLLDALERACNASRSVPVQAVLVHAKDEKAAAFYSRYGFISFPGLPLQLFLPMGTIDKLFTIG